jgi:protein SCO1
VFFGFTHCPDVCPTTLLKLARVKQAAGIANLRVLFVSIDPQRDTPQAVGLYVHAFDPAFAGLTGQPAAIAAVAQQFGVAVSRVDLPGGDYTMDHSAVVFLLDDAAHIDAIFTPPFEVAAMAADLRAAAAYLTSARS